MTRKTIVLLSGGLDSTTALAIAKSQGYGIFAISFDYGQRHKIELDQAKKIAHHMAVEEHHIVNIDLRQLKSRVFRKYLENKRDKSIKAA